MIWTDRTKDQMSEGYFIISSFYDHNKRVTKINQIEREREMVV